MRKPIITLLTVLTIGTTTVAQDFNTFKANVPVLTLANEIKIEKEADATRHPINQQDRRTILQENDGAQFALGKILLPKTTVIIYYTKPEGVAPIGKITAATFTDKGKKISSEAIGVFADFAGMHFNTSFIVSSQANGAIAISSNVIALKSSGEVNPDMSKNSTYYISAKGKIGKL
jgi:hypothetical protein